MFEPLRPFGSSGEFVAQEHSIACRAIVRDKLYLHRAYVWLELQAEAYRFALDVLLADGRAHVLLWLYLLS